MMNFLIKGPILLASCTHNSTLLWFSISFYSPRKMWTLTPTKISPHRKTWTLCHCMHCLKSNCISKCSSSFIDSFWGKPFVASEYNSLPPVSRLCCSAVNYDLRLWLLRTQGVNRNSHAALSSIINEHHLHHSAPSILSGSGWLMSGKMEPKLIIKQGKLLRDKSFVSQS